MGFCAVPEVEITMGFECPVKEMPWFKHIRNELHGLDEGCVRSHFKYVGE